MADARADISNLVALSTERANEALEGVSLESLAGEAQACLARLEQAGSTPPLELRTPAWDLLDVLRRPPVLRRIPAEEHAVWSTRILRLIEASHFTVGFLLQTRVAVYGSRPLFQIENRSGVRSWSWRQTAARVETLARALLSLLRPDGGRLAILADNRVEIPWIDLACLSAGIVNIPIPANATENDVGYILEHSKAQAIVVTSGEQLHKVQQHRESLPALEHVILLDAAAAPERGMITLDQLTTRVSGVSPAALQQRIEAVRVDDLATIMYTSGTTGTPKAIQFSQRNIVFKRFARALALPEIGDHDVFLCYLPLFHTFGRFLEMLGCVFWGSTYCFLLDPSVRALIRGMRRHRPTMFISVPRKWIQLYEAICTAADPQVASDELLLEATRRMTGGRLNWGLSAAGHLDPEIFRFFQHQGTELMSGFGMTEATGGITMTPPGAYRDESLGVALPGIDVCLADDGEMLVRGPYVMTGYLQPPDGEASFDAQGWFHTGDLMEIDAQGHYQLVDRKKEIYKNIKGETIAPQRVENLFRDLDAVERVFLVGDHREYNTALIYPNPHCKEPEFSSMDAETIQDHFRSLVVSVNKFLAPYERIVDFAIIDRDLDPERGELTAKGTPRRRVVERNFIDIVRSLYRRTNIHTGGLELQLPNWLFQALGLTAREIMVGDGEIRLRTTGARLIAHAENDTEARIGSCIYRHSGGAIKLGALLTTPRLWLGNEQLVDFLQLELPSRRRPRGAKGLEWVRRAEPLEPDPATRAALAEARRLSEHDLMHLHLAARTLQSADEEVAGKAVRLIETMLGKQEGALLEPARFVLNRAADDPRAEIRRRAFLVLVQAERDARFPATLERFLDGPDELLDATVRGALVDRDLSHAKLGAFVGVLRGLDAESDWTQEQEQRATGLAQFLAEFGAVHPTRYRELRALLTRMMLFACHEPLRAAAQTATSALREGFRQWLGPTQRIAVDPETGREYRWQDVVAFDRSVPDEDQQQLLTAIRDTSFLREAVFLFSQGGAVRLSDIPPGGIWIRLLGSRHGKSVYRITIQTRYQGSYEVAANVNHELDPRRVREEIQWLILCGESRERDPLVEDFGGYWDDQDLWSEEFIPGETLDRALKRRSRKPDEIARLKQNWPFYAWSAACAYVDFWQRTGRRQQIAAPSTSSVIVPTHDYLTGGRLVSVSARKPFAGVCSMLTDLREKLIDASEELYPALAGLAEWGLVFSALLEIVGERDGVEMLRALREEDPAPPMRRPLEQFLQRVEARGYLPQRLFFAAKRYRRWAALNQNATAQARGRQLRELYDDYGLARVNQRHAEARVRFFRYSVFYDAAPPLAEGLDEIIGQLRGGKLVGDAVVDAVADLRSRLDLGPDEDYFLARLSYPHLRPEDDAGFVRTRLGGRHQSEVVVTVEDHDGDPFLVRHALNPKEVDRLHRLFLQANLDVRFRPEHQYLVALNERMQIIGGIYYEIEEDHSSAHLEKIVVAERHQKKGIAGGLMHEFFNRLRAAGVAAVTTGFYRPEYFYGFGFSIEKRYAGLVKTLADDEDR